MTMSKGDFQVQVRKKPSAEQRKELGRFLASRRARVKPSDLGLSGGLRRTPGLRREEVAMMAGVSLSWYTWLEQGRDIQASPGTLKRISEVLRLDRTEAAYLFALSSREQPLYASDEKLTDGLFMLVEAIDPIPAYIRNSRLDILAWNPAIADLFVDYGALDPRERNTLRLLFLHSPYRSTILDWEQIAMGMLSVFRASRAKAQDKKPFDAIVEDLTRESAEFREWWPNLGVRGFGEGQKRLQHPKFGRVEFTYVTLVPEGHPDLSLVVYIPRAADRHEPASSMTSARSLPSIVSC